MNVKRARALSLVFLGLLIFTMASGGAALAAPSKFLPFSQWGWEVDQKTGEDVCTVASGDPCSELGKESAEPGGFSVPQSVAEAPNGNVYVADKANFRVQELTSSGAFVLMFGWKVDKTTGGNLCTAASHDTCGAGENGTGLPEQQWGGQDVAVDPETKDVYLLEVRYNRVEQFTENGEFILMIGGHVNETTGGNLCTEAEVIASGVKCKAGVEGTETSAFTTASGMGNLLAVGGPKHLLYVGDLGRVQEFDPSGTFVHSLPLEVESDRAKAIAVDSLGDVFVVQENLAGIREYSASDALQPLVLDPENETISSLALDAYGRLGLVQVVTVGTEVKLRGAIYTAADVEVSEFGPVAAGNGLAFATNGVKPSDHLYVATGGLGNEIQVFAPVVFPELHSCGAGSIGPASAVLCGEVDPNGIPAEAFFEYGLTKSLGSKTPVGTAALRKPSPSSRTNSSGYCQIRITTSARSPKSKSKASGSSLESKRNPNASTRLLPRQAFPGRRGRRSSAPNRPCLTPP
jgi:DNA-binding beta-propeller fold protein YncE